MIKFIFDLLNKAMDKVFSARFIITVLMGYTYCRIVWHCVFFYTESLKNDPPRMEAFVTGLIMGFTGLATFIFKAYFDRLDRAGGEQTPSKTDTIKETPKL